MVEQQNENQQQDAVEEGGGRSTLRVPLPSELLGTLEVDFDSVDPVAETRMALHALALDKEGLIEGIPMPLEGEELVLNEKYPLKELFDKVQEKKKSKLDNVHVRNRFYHERRRVEIVIFEEVEGKIEYAVVPHMNSIDSQMHTLNCSSAWGVEQEFRALRLLNRLIPDFKFKQYVLTGAFLERSRRSNVMYIFRKLRPTVAISTSSGETAKILCALCLHPIGYYAGSWAGAMCPTDDVISHLMLMRGDEKMFWRQSGQHPPWSSLAGL